MDNTKNSLKFLKKDGLFYPVVKSGKRFVKSINDYRQMFKNKTTEKHISHSNKLSNIYEVTFYGIKVKKHCTTEPFNSIEEIFDYYINYSSSHPWRIIPDEDFSYESKQLYNKYSLHGQKTSEKSNKKQKKNSKLVKPKKQKQKTENTLDYSNSKTLIYCDNILIGIFDDLIDKHKIASDVNDFLRIKHVESQEFKKDNNTHIKHKFKSRSEFECSIV